MNNQFGGRMVNAQADVIGEPGRSEPASPILAKEHAYSAKQREESNEQDPDDVVFGRMHGVVGQRDNADGNEQPAYDRDGERALVHSNSDNRRARWLRLIGSAKT